MSIVICLVTAPSRESAVALAKGVVEKRLAACVNIVPGVESVYRWEGSMVMDEEALMVIKSSEERVAALREEIFKQHPYSVPEFVVFSPKDVSPAYAEWILGSLTTDALSLEG